MTEQTARPGRNLGLVAAIALVMGNMIGSGVFLLPASLAPFGWNAIGGWIFTIGGSLVLAWTIACLTRQVRDADDLVGFITKAFGPLAGVLLGWNYLITIWVATVTIAVAAVSYFSALVPGIDSIPFGPVLGALVIVWTITLINLRGTHTAGNFQILTTVIKVLPLLLVIALAVGLLVTGDAELAPFEPAKIAFPHVSAAAALCLWALLGFETASAAAQQVRDPEINVPRATMFGTALTGLFYLLVCSAVGLMLPQEVASTSPAPLATFVERFWNPGPAAFVSLFAIVSCIGAVNGWVLVQGEMPRAMAVKGEMPRWFAGTDARGTPRRALVFGSLVASYFLLLNSGQSMQGLFEFLLLLTTSAVLWFYLALALAAWKLKVARPFAVLGAAYSVWTLWGAGFEADAWSLALTLLGLPIYWWTRREARLAAHAT